MKKNYLLLTLLLMIIFFSSCKKRSDVNTNVEIDEKNLTQCQQDTQCDYFFTEYADFSGEYNINRFKEGNYRVFWSRWQGLGMTTSVQVKVPMQGNSFSLGKSDILNGNVSVSRSCSSCNMIAMHAVDGYVKGRNLTPEQPSDRTKWILEAQVIMEEIPSLSVSETPRKLYRDTISVKQYFYPNFIYN